MRRPLPANVRELLIHISEFGLHMHRTNDPHGWRLIASDTGYRPCPDEKCLKTEPALERS